jgi:hypothetical protein
MPEVDQPGLGPAARDLDFPGLLHDVGRIARQPEFDTVRRRADGLRTRRAMTFAGAVLAVVAVSGAAGFAALRPSDATLSTGAAPPSTGPAPGGTPSASAEAGPAWPYLRWSGAADANHVYTVVADCRTCAQRLRASSDGGRTWQTRHTWNADHFIDDVSFTVVGRETLIGIDLLRPASGIPPVSAGPTSSGGLRRLTEADVKNHGTPQSLISSDDGSTWKKLSVSDQPVAAAPADGGVVGADYAGGGPADRLYAVDPATGAAAPLAHQPGLARFQLAQAPTGAGVWVQGYDPTTHRPAVAISRDRGATWAVSAFSAESPAPFGSERTATMYLPRIATADGQTAYAIFAGQEGRVRVYRSLDGGRTWRRTDHDGHLGAASLAGPESFVSGDGGHVVPVQPAGRYGYVSSRDGGDYVPQAVTGLPSVDRLPQVVGKDDYLYQGKDLLYHSTDGLHWQPLTRP